MNTCWSFHTETKESLWSPLLSSWVLDVTEIHLPAFLLRWSSMANAGG